jgi:hypothetical protein
VSAVGRFFDLVRRSIYAPPFYAALPARSGGAAFGYFVALTAVLALLFGLTLLPGLIAFHTRAGVALETALATYPDELVVEVRDGEASANVPQPYLVPMPPSWRDADSPANLLVIDTTQPFNFAQRNRYDTVALLAQDALVFKDDNGSDRSLDLAQLASEEPFTIDKAMVLTVGDYARPWFRFIGPVLVPLAVGGVWLAYLFRLLYLALFAFVIWLLGRLVGQHFGYGGSYKVGLHAMTLALLVDVVVALSRTWTGFGGFPFMFSLITAIVVLVNYLPARGAAPAGPPPQPYTPPPAEPAAPPTAPPVA